MSTSSTAVTGHRVGCPMLHITGARCTCFDAPTEMASLVEIKSRLAAIQEVQAEIKGDVYGAISKFATQIYTIEQDINVLKGVGQELLSGQGVLCERLDALAKQMTTLTVSCAALNANHKAIAAKLDVLLTRQPGKQKSRKVRR